MSEETEAVFDEDELLKRLAGDRELGRGVVSGFLEDIPQQIGTLKRHLIQRDAPLVGRLAHTIKGAAATIGADALRKAALEIERAGKAGELDRAVTILSRLEDEFERLKSAIEQLNWT